MLPILFILGSLGFLSLLGQFVDKSVGTIILVFVEEKFGAFPHLLLYCLIEWVVILLIYGDAFLSFLSNEVSRLFELWIPCLLCTRIDHPLVNGRSSWYCNGSLCDLHKKVASSLAYCNAHKKLSDSHTMCQGCLLSSATERDYAGILQKDVDFFLEDDPKGRVKASTKDEQPEIHISDDESGISRCSCCGEPMKLRSSSKHKRGLSMINTATPYSRAPSVRNIEGVGNVDSAEVKLVPDGELELPEDEDASNVDVHGRQDAKAAMSPWVPDSYETYGNDSRTPTTPILGKGNRFFGSALLDSMHQMSPRWANRDSRKPSFDKRDSVLLLNDEKDGGDILTRSKKQVELNRKSLMALYMELDEERSASAIAANNAMAMITRLQAEKAAVQMEALQYKRMKEEQAEYDQEALKGMKNLQLKREEDAKELEARVEMYRQKYGHIKNVGSQVCEVDIEEDYQDMKSQTMLTSECGSMSGGDPRENDQNTSVENDGGNIEEDFQEQRSHLLGLLKNLEESTEVAQMEPEDDENDEASGKFTRELSLMRERIRVIEADSGFLQHTAMTLGRQGEEGTKLLTEIAQHLRHLRLSDKSPSEAEVQVQVQAQAEAATDV